MNHIQVGTSGLTLRVSVDEAKDSLPALNLTMAAIAPIPITGAPAEGARTGSPATVMIFSSSTAFLACIAVLISILLPSIHVARGQGCLPELQWTRTSANPLEPGSQAMTYDPARGRVVMLNDDGDTWEYDGTSWTQRSPAVSPPARRNYGTAYDAARGVVVIYGGDSIASGPLADTWEYDGTSWTQRSPADSPRARWGHRLVYDAARGKVVLFGGYDGSGALADTWEYDGTNWTQRRPADSPVARYAHALVYDSARGKTVLFGGRDAISYGFADSWEYDGTTWTLLRPAAAPEPRAFHAMTYDVARGKVVVFGGSFGARLFSDTWEYGGTNWTPRSPPTSPSARSAFAMTYDSARGLTVVFGGYSLSDTWEYDGTTWTLRSSATSITARGYPAMAFDAGRPGGGKVVLFGGWNGREYLSGTWEYDGTAWELRSPPVRPPGRYAHAMVYDSARGRVVLIGGIGTTTPYDTWEYDGTTWLRRSQAIAMSARAYHAMIYDSARNKVVLFGGDSSISPGLGQASDTWEYDGTTWTQRAPATSPPGRRYHAMAYDSARGRVVLFGGFNNSSGSLSDTWEYDGTTWSQRSPAVSPPARQFHTMVFDPSRGAAGRVVLYGGQSGGVRLSETWEYDGTTWTQLNSAGPLGRYGHAMVYDASRAGGGRVVVFGGFNGASYVSDTWEFGLSALGIRRQPASRSVAAGRYTDLNLVAEGNLPLTYQWRRDGVALSNTVNITGAASSVLQIGAVSADEVGLYTCVVTDACGGTITSASAAVTFCRADFNARGAVTVQDILDFLAAWFDIPADPRADFNGSGDVSVQDIFDFLAAWFAGC